MSHTASLKSIIPPSESPVKRYFVGIDPGRDTGICIYNSKDKCIEHLFTKDFWGTIDMINTVKFAMATKICQGMIDHTTPREEVARLQSTIMQSMHFQFVIEDPNLNAPVFDRGKNQRVMMKIGEGVGRNKEQAFLLIEYMKRHTIDHRIVRPSTAKWNAMQFKQITTFTESTNQHERDAAKLVIGL